MIPRHRLLLAALVAAPLLAAPVVTSSVASASVPGWQPTGAMAKVRYGHVAAALPDGRVLAVSGFNQTENFVAESELWNPATGTWSPAASLPVPVLHATATTLNDGQVLVAGGTTSGGVTDAAYRYDPDSDTWTTAASMLSERTNHAAVLLDDGRVLVTGGMDNSGGQGGTGAARSSAEIYDPSANTWTSAGTFAEARQSHQAVTLRDGRVMVVGGHDFSGGLNFRTTASVFDPSTGTWSPLASMMLPRSSSAAGVLADGSVLVSNGFWFFGAYDGASRFDPGTGTWTELAASGATGQTAAGVSLPDGRFLVTASSSTLTPLYDVTSGWNREYRATSARSDRAVTLTSDGRVLMTGGVGFSSAELFTAPPAPPTPPAPTPPPPTPPAPSPQPDPRPVPVPSPQPAPPSGPVSCSVPFVAVTGLTAAGTDRTPTVRIDATATPVLAGQTVTVRRGNHNVGTGRVSSVGTIRVTVPAPRNARQRNAARYRLVVGGSLQTPAMKATRRVAAVRTAPMADGRTRITGTVAGVRARTTLTLKSTPVCGGSERTQRVRSDRRGGFRVTAAAPADGVPAVVHRVWLAQRSVTLPVVVTARR